jgi:2-haloalkanoic acid dehalogenase type II
VTRQLDQFSVISLDCYGTLIDWETGIWEALQPLLAGTGVERQAALAVFAAAESAQQAATPEMSYPGVLRAVHAALAEHFHRQPDGKQADAFGASIGDWPPFSDSAVALQRLQQRYKLVILSNVDKASFAGSNAHLGVAFDAIYTAEDIGTYKPSANNFEYLVDHLASDFGVGREGVLHTAQSLFHDHVPAIRAGLATCWIDRQRLSAGGDWGATAMVDELPPTDFVFFSLEELADAAGV